MTNQGYKTLPGGSIDYAFYINRSHEIRAKDATGFIKKIVGLFGKSDKPARKSQPIEAPQVPLRKLRTRGGEWRQRQMAGSRLELSDLKA